MPTDRARSATARCAAAAPAARRRRSRTGTPAPRWRRAAPVVAPRGLATQRGWCAAGPDHILHSAGGKADSSYPQTGAGMHLARLNNAQSIPSTEPRHHAQLYHIWAQLWGRDQIERHASSDSSHPSHWRVRKVRRVALSRGRTPVWCRGSSDPLTRCGRSDRRRPGCGVSSAEWRSPRPPPAPALRSRRPPPRCPRAGVWPRAARPGEPIGYIVRLPMYRAPPARLGRATVAASPRGCYAHSAHQLGGSPCAT